MTQQVRNLRHGKVTVKDGSGTPKVLEIAPMKGDLKFDEHSKTQIVMNRGRLDSRIEGDQEPINITFQVQFAQWSYANAGVGVSPRDAIHGPEAPPATNSAQAWVSVNPCGPYAVDLFFDIANPCDPGKAEHLVFRNFHADSIGFAEGDPANMLTVTGTAFVISPERSYN